MASVNMLKKTLLGITCVTFALSGCQPSEELEPVSPVGDIVGPLKAEYQSKAAEAPMAGNPRQPLVQDKQAIVSSAGRIYASRYNPFSLKSDEAAFETQIRYNFILNKMSPSYALELVAAPPEIPIELQPMEPQPYRRVAGVIFGDSVRALIIEEGGKSYFVSPGDMIGDWLVASIDAEKVVLERDPRKRPNRLEIRVESQPAFLPSGGAPGGAGGGAPGAAGAAPPGGGGGGGRTTGADT
ncbi:MAG TPA: hypothetical protein VNK96_04395 [Fimbriimonadales bacterium]|nr:hypothetical protein [Fimbriimonadales bacterium]